MTDLTTDLTTDQPDEQPTRTVALLANFCTRNLGNHALTMAMQSLVVDAYGDSSTLRLHRMPHPVADLVTRAPHERWATETQRVVGLDPAQVDVGVLARHHDIEIPPDGREAGERSLLRRLAARAAHTTPGLRLRARASLPTARTHLAGLLAADDVVWVPGGEIGPWGVNLGRVLDVSLARSTGKHVLVADFSFEPSDDAVPEFRRLLPTVDMVVPRDRHSAERLADLGLPAERLRVVPDAVFLVGTPAVPYEIPRPSTAPRLAIVPNGGQEIDVETWRHAIRAALAKGYEIEAVSSALEQDLPTIRTLLSGDLEGKVAIGPEITDVGGYLQHLSGFSALLSGRFHSAVMGVLCGLVVSGVDTFGTKVTGGLSEAGFGEVSVTPEGVRTRDWVDAFADRLEHGTPADPAQIAATQRQIVEAYGELLGARRR